MTSETPVEYGDILNITPHESSVKGGESITITFVNPIVVPEDSTYFIFQGSKGEHRVPATRLGPTSLVATIPAYLHPETVDLSLCSVSECGTQRTLYTNQFTYFFDQKAFMAELLFQNLSEIRSPNVENSVLPPLTSAEALRDYDLSLTKALNEIKIPEGWSMVGDDRIGQHLSPEEGYEPKETLLHFAARYNLNCLAQRLISMPGSSVAAVLPNSQGHLPIDLARENNNEGLVRLLTLYMRQVSPDGRLVDSLSSGPEEGLRGEETPAGRVDYEALIKQIEAKMGSNNSTQEMARINEKWMTQVRCYRKHSLGSLISGLRFSKSSLPIHRASSDQRAVVSLSKVDKRRERFSSSSFASGSPGSGSADAGGSPTTVLECVSMMQDPEVVEMDRRRKMSWSVTVGCARYRSMDTGLNELERIVAEETLQKKVLTVKSELMEMEQQHKSSNTLGSSNQSGLHLRSLSCPFLDHEDDSASPCMLSSEPSSSSITGIADDGSLHTPPTPSASAQYTITPRSIPRVITTKYSDSSLTVILIHPEADPLTQHGEDHSDQNTTSSLDDLDSSSVKEIRGNVARSKRAQTLQAQTLPAPELSEDDGIMSAYSAPNLLTLSDSEEQEDQNEEQEHAILTRQPDPRLQGISVEDSIVEHRSLRQMGNSSPMYDELRDTGTDHTHDSAATSVDSDFVMVQSPSQSDVSKKGNGKKNENSEDESITRRSAKSGHWTKSHRRSLSTSDAESMRDTRKSMEMEDTSDRPNTTANCNTVLTPINNDGSSPVLDMRHGSGNSSHSRKLDADEHSQTDSIQTLDTSSHQGSDDSSEEEKETDDQVSALDSQVSLDHLTTGAPNHTNNLSPVVTSNRVNRYSADAEYIVTNIDDELTYEDGEITPTSVLARFSHRRINSTNVPLSSSADMADGAENNSSIDTLVFKGGEEKEKKTSLCSNDSVFMNSAEADVVHLSDVDIKVNHSDDSRGQSLNSSFDVSLEQSTELDELYFKQNGSPKTIRKKKGAKSPTPKRKTVHVVNRGESSKIQKKGLQKSEVSPTIQTLRKLMNLEEPEESDDSDATVGSNPRRTGSALEMSSLTGVHRSSSSVSDSVAIKQMNNSGDTSPFSRTGSPGSIRCPLKPADLENDNEGSSLDFIPGSPLAAMKHQQQLKNQPHPHPHTSSSPLSLQQTKSPPSQQNHSSMFSGNEHKIHSSNSSPTFSVSSTPGNTTPTSKMEGDVARNENHAAETSAQKILERKRSKLGKAISFYEGGTERVTDLLCEDEKPADKDHESAVKKLLRGGFLRGSKQNSKKIPKASSTNSEQVQSNTSPAKQTRAKSAKVRNKPSESSSTEALPLSPSSITRSASMQVGMDEAGSNPTTTTQQYPNRSSRRLSTQMTRYNSEDILSSPVKTANGSTFRIMEEIPGSPKEARVTWNVPNSPPSCPLSEGESDNEESASMEHISHHPELYLKEEVPWERTIDRKVYKKIGKGERERQAILHELLHTERQHFRALHVLKLIFRNAISKRVSEDILEQLFPKLDNLIEISDSFIKRMEGKREKGVIRDLSDILLQQFSGESYDKMLSAFSGFCSGHLNAMEIYRELLRKKNFARLMKEMHSVKECQRLELTDYYTKVTQRLSQLIILMNRLAKKTESLKLDHCSRLQESLKQLQRLVGAVDQSVEDRKNLMEMMDIESRLEINVPKSSKITNRQDLKNLKLTAHNRKLKKKGYATWMGHGRQLTVQVVLVTDLLILLTERDQKFHLASLQDLKPPVIRLYDLMVRTNVSVKSGVQLLLVEQSSTPEMYKLDFVDKKKAKEWLTVLNNAIDDCKEKGLKCEYFGAERVTSDEEDKKEKEAESGEEGKVTKGASKVGIVPSISDPEMERRKRLNEVMKRVNRILNSSTLDTNAASRAILNRQRAQTIRPTSYFPGVDSTDVGGSSATYSTARDHVISYPQPLQQKGTKPVKEKKKVVRSSTFKSKEKKDDKDKDRQTPESMGILHDDGSSISEQEYISCIKIMKSLLEEMMTETSEKTKMIAQLRSEKESLKVKASKEQKHGEERMMTLERVHDGSSTSTQKSSKSAKSKKKKEHNTGNESPVNIRHKSPRSSPPMPRPYSSYTDLNEPLAESFSLVHSVGSVSDFSSQNELTVTPGSSERSERSKNKVKSNRVEPVDLT